MEGLARGSFLILEPKLDLRHFFWLRGVLGYR